MLLSTLSSFAQMKRYYTQLYGSLISINIYQVILDSAKLAISTNHHADFTSCCQEILNTFQIFSETEKWKPTEIIKVKYSSLKKNQEIQNTS